MFTSTSIYAVCRLQLLSALSAALCGHKRLRLRAHRERLLILKWQQQTTTGSREQVTGGVFLSLIIVEGGAIA